jgi:hypothetical protein
MLIQILREADKTQRIHFKYRGRGYNVTYGTEEDRIFPEIVYAGGMKQD